MKSKIKEVPRDDLEAIGQIGAQKIANLQRRYSPVQMEIIEERQLFKKKLDHWEAGYKIFGRALFAFSTFGAFFGWLIGPTFINLIASLGLSKRGISSIIWFIVAMALYNIADVGRIWLFFPKNYYGKEDKDIKKKEESSVKEASEIDKKALVAAVKKEIEKQGGMSTTNIINLLKIDIKPRELGMLLKDSGFLQQRGRSGRVWQPPQPIDIICDTSVDRSMTEE